MSKIKGQYLRLKFGTKWVALATDATLHVSASFEDSSTKDDYEGMWQDQELTGLAWDISTSALYSVDADATGINAEDALDMMIAHEKVWVEFTQTTGQGDKNRTAASGHMYAGWAIVNDISVNASNRANATYTLQAQGSGPLIKNGTPVSGSDI